MPNAKRNPKEEFSQERIPGVQRGRFSHTCNRKPTHGHLSGLPNVLVPLNDGRSVAQLRCSVFRFGRCCRHILLPTPHVAVFESFCRGFRRPGYLKQYACKPLRNMFRLCQLTQRLIMPAVGLPVPSLESSNDQRSCDFGMQVVLYDTSGLFSSPRVWWLYRTFGHER